MSHGMQPELFVSCRWCGLPAVGEVVVWPEQFKKDKDGIPQLVKAAHKEWACDEHIQITVDQPPDMTTFRRRKDKSAEQLDLFGGSDPNGPKNAIYGDAA